MITLFLSTKSQVILIGDKYWLVCVLLVECVANLITSFTFKPLIVNVSNFFVALDGKFLVNIT